MQHDQNLANQTGAAFRADANDALGALFSNSSGATAPSTTVAYQWWADTANGLLKIRNAANSAWITVGDLTVANLGLADLEGAAEFTTGYFSDQLLLGTDTSQWSADSPLEATGAEASFFRCTGAAGSPVQVLQHDAATGDNVYIRFYTPTPSTQIGYIDHNRAAGQLRVNGTSDYRSKTVLGPIANPLERLMQLRPVRARMNGATMDIDAFVAHEFAEVVPEGVSGEKDAVDAKGNPIMQGMDPRSAIPLLTAALQELAERFQAYVESHP